jgi:uncharacterized membrane protein YciS (DUF1049 family)
MRVIKALAALCFVALGIVFGALNRQHVRVDFALAQVDGRLGFLLLAVMLAGAFLGGLAVMAGVVWPMRRRTRAGGERNSGPVTGEFPALREPPR